MESMCCMPMLVCPWVLVFLVFALALCTPIVLGVRDILFAFDTRDRTRAARGIALVVLGVALVVACWTLWIWWISPIPAQ